MKIRTVYAAASVAVAAALVAPQDAAADCRLPMHHQYRGYGAVGSFKIAGGVNFGLGDNEQTVYGADGSYAFADKAALRLGLGYCDSGALSSITFGGQLLSDLYVGADNVAKIQGAVGVNYVDLDGITRTSFPIQLNGRYAVAPTVDIWGGPEVTYNRASAGGGSFSDTVFGVNAGVTADFNDDVAFRTGISAQFWEGQTQYGLSTSLTYKVPMN